MEALENLRYTTCPAFAGRQALSADRLCRLTDFAGRQDYDVRFWIAGNSYNVFVVRLKKNSKLLLLT
jgi:hypothetical protein